MNNLIKFLIVITFSFSLCLSCFYANSKIEAKIVKTIEVRKPKEIAKLYLIEKLVDYKILFNSNLKYYYLKIQYDGGEVIYSDTIVLKKLHDIDLKYTGNFDFNRFKNNKLKINVLLSSLEGEGDFQIDLALPVFYRTCSINHTYLEVGEPRSEFEVNSGFIYDGIEYTNYALLSYKEERSPLPQ